MSSAQGIINFTSITTKEGISSNTIYTMVKDRYGLMWFGTSNGLSRYDGTNFTIYRHEPNNPASMPGNEVLSLYEDRTGKIWIGTGAGGLSYYDRTKDRIVSYPTDGSWPEQGSVSPRAILQDDQGKLWVGTYGNLRLIDLSNGHTTRMVFHDTPNNMDYSFVVLSLFEDSRRQIWVGTNKGLFLYDRQKGYVKKYGWKPNAQVNLSNSTFKGITEDRKGDIWLATLDGLGQLKPDGTLKVYRHRTDGANAISSNAVFAVKLDKDGKVWIGTEEGLDILDPLTGSFQVLQPDPRNLFSLKSKSIRSIYIDNTGIYWVGTFGRGIAKYDKNLPLFNLKQSDPFDPWGLRSNSVLSFTESANGQIYVGTDGAGIEVFNRETGLFKPLIIKSKLDKTGLGIVVFRLYIDKSGFLWAGTYRNGLFRINLSDGSYEQFTAGKGQLNNDNVNSLAEDGRGNLWIGTIGGGVNIYNFKLRTFQQFNSSTFPPGFKQPLPLNDFISSIAKSPKGDMWIGSAGTGLAVFNPVTGKVIHYTRAHKELPYDVVEHLFFSKDGLLWLSTEGGLSFLDEQTHKITTYSEKDGLGNGMVKGILEDNSGLIWVSTDRGISSFNRSTKTFRNFNAENGVQQSSFTTAATMKSANGDLFFGGLEGFNFFNPATLPDTRSPGQVLLTDLNVSNESVTPGENSPIKEQIGMAKEINLHYGLNFSVSYVALNYTAPKQNQFAYKLVGFDKDWNYVHHGRTANYTNLDPGTYIFQVKASSDGKHWVLPPTEVRIIVSPPFWRTGYAYGFYFLTTLAFLLWLRRRGIRKIRREFEIQQEKIQVKQLMEQERREADQLHELDLLKIKFLTDLSHEFRTPISLILAPVEKLLERKLANEAQEDVKMINRNARRLLNMVNQLLDFRKMEEEELHLHLQTGDVIYFIKDTADAFKDVAARKEIDFSVESKCKAWATKFDHNKLERIIFNTLSNAFKFTPKGGQITMFLEISEVIEGEPHLIMRIMDRGIGIPSEDLTRIFDRFYQHQTQAVLNQGTGIGLAITKEFVNLHGGHIHAENNLSGGACIVIDLPVFPELDESGISETDGKESTASDSCISNTSESVPCNPKRSEGIRLIEKKITILLVEDNEEFRTYLADHLKQYYNIIQAGDGKEGWQKTLGNHPQLVVSDINMPLMSGIELSKKIKEDKRTCHIPVILLTAMTGEEEQLTGLQSGASDYLTKPFNFQILNTKIGNLLDLNKSLKDTYSKQIQLVGQEVVTESGNLKLLNSIMKYIESKLSDSDLSVEELSKHVGMSRGSLYYKLIELTGLSPIEYIRCIKLEKAAALLENSELNIAQIAYMTGFGTPSYFSRMFKNKYGMVPSEYLNSKRNHAKPVVISAE
ncbi:hybrid sensor histidine kinase/response regulator transcription factor [Mucilaginibacter gracilis]|uniref:hybrid sensor histidine kinase/response regulator transcription factor n=1 Tax=Mucilaginibacter gracilis TaxID=423350 RepID=UPI0013C2EE38|nr:two-component regulator propeller domain-containing protein [Mucilaginibacter gracilis]